MELPHLPLSDELSISQIVRVLNLLVDGFTNGFHFDPWHFEPSDKIEGTLVYADGTDWNPGSGAGFYYWSGSAWVKL